MSAKNLKVGVFVDAVNLTRNGGYGMQYDVLREFAVRDGGEIVRLNAYVAFDKVRAETDTSYKMRSLDFYAVLRELGFKVIEKHVKWYTDEYGERYGKANSDMEMALDALMQTEHLDRVLLATGDGDFTRVVRTLQNRGTRVEVVAFENVSSSLKREADLFMSGYLIPNLLPTHKGNMSVPEWGEMFSRVRGICYSFNQQKRFGFFRYLGEIRSNLWVTDSRREDSPYETAFAHESHFPPNIDITGLPNRHQIFEFELERSDRGIIATDIEVIETEVLD